MICKQYEYFRYRQKNWAKTVFNSAKSKLVMTCRLPYPSKRAVYIFFVQIVAQWSETNEI